MLVRAADGIFPPVDGGVEFVDSWRPDLAAIVSFTGHAVVATSGDLEPLTDAPADGYGMALAPHFLALLAGPSGDVGVIDATLVARGSGALLERSDLEDHPRVRYARSLRDDVLVYGDERGLVTLARGLAGRIEVSVDVAPTQVGAGIGRSLIRDALGMVAADQPVFAAVAPGNARSLRAVLSVGFVPIGSEVIIRVT